MSPAKSRYSGIQTVEYQMADGRRVAYLRRRFVPVSADTVLLAEYTVKQGERLDNITARYLGDPTQFWQVCDANNNCMNPEDLVQVGNRISLYPPQRG